MVKIQQFFTIHKKHLVLIMTLLIVIAEIFHFGFKQQLVYQLLMAITGVVGLIPIILTAISSLQVKIISIDLLVSLAVIGAFIIGEFNEAAIVTWLFIGGEVLENFTLQKTRSAVKELTQLAPKTALVVNEDESTHQEDVDSLDAGTKVLVKTGSQIPVDGVITQGTGFLNEASITGESKLNHKTVDDHVFAGTILENGTLIVKTTSVGEDTTFGKIIELVEEAQDSKTKTQNFIDKFSQYYTPFVLLISIIVGLLTKNLRLAITVMVLGCPGALVIGVPVSTVVGIGDGAKNGILFKGSNVMDQLRKVDIIAFDKTGTLTVGKPEVTKIQVINGNEQTIIDQIVAIERESNHPLAQAINKLKVTKRLATDHVQTIPGKGLKAEISNQEFVIGNQSLIEQQLGINSTLNNQIKHLSNLGNSIVVFANLDQSELAIFAIKDHLRFDASEALHALKKLGIKKLVMLTGDNQEIANQIANQIPLDQVKAKLLPQDKAKWIKQEQAKDHHVAFVGDGINDSPALSTADVAIAMGSGTDIAMDVADLVLVKSKLTSLVTGRQLAAKTIKNMNENIVIALITVILLFIGLFVGYIAMASGMFIHELSILLVIFNSMRLMKFKSKLDHHQFLMQAN